MSTNLSKHFWEKPLVQSYTPTSFKPVSGIPLSANGLLNDAILSQLAMWIFNFHMHTVTGACDHNVIS